MLSIKSTEVSHISHFFNNKEEALALKYLVKTHFSPKLVYSMPDQITNNNQQHPGKTPLN